MATPLQDFYAYLKTEAAKVSNTFDKFRVLALIESWYATYLAVDALRSTTTTAYSLNGRSVTRQSLPSLTDDLNRLQRDIEDILYLRSISLVDARGFYSQGWPTAGGSVAT